MSDGLDNPYSGITTSTVERWFRLSVERNPGLFWFCFGFTLLCDWSSKLPPHFPPIRFKTNTNRVSVPCFRKFACSIFEFHWLLVIISFVLIGCCDHYCFSFNVTQSKYALNRHFLVKDSPIRQNDYTKKQNNKRTKHVAKTYFLFLFGRAYHLSSAPNTQSCNNCY